MCSEFFRAMEEYYTNNVSICEKEEGDYVVWYYNYEGINVYRLTVIRMCM